MVLISYATGCNMLKYCVLLFEDADFNKWFTGCHEWHYYLFNHVVRLHRVVMGSQ